MTAFKRHGWKGLLAGLVLVWTASLGGLVLSEEQKNGTGLPAQLAQTGATPNPTEAVELTATAEIPTATPNPEPTATPQPTRVPDKIVPIDQVYFVSVSALNVRQGPDTAFPVLDTLSLGAEIKGEQLVNDSWVKASFSAGKTGFFFLGGLSLNKPAPTPTPVPIEAKIKHGKYIDVNLSTQYLRAFNAGVVEFETYISSGTKGYETPTGTFSIYARVPSQTMTGGSVARGDYYNIPNVQHVQYFHGEYGFHSAYWHNNFGYPMSHGCINLRTSDAKWLYDWATFGTPVVVHY